MRGCFPLTHPPDRRTTVAADGIDTMREMADFSYRQ